MADTLPAIKLTDTNNQEKEPVRPFSPAGDTPPPSFDAAVREARGRPQTPTSKSKPIPIERPDSGSASSGLRSSPARLRRTLSNPGRRSSEPAREEVNGKQDTTAQPAGIDPLSQHILSRTNAPFNASSGRSSPSDHATNRGGRGSIDQGSSPTDLSNLQRTDSIDSVNAHKDLRKGVKAVAFISKLMGNKKKDDERPTEDESVSDGTRPEGNDVEAFVQAAESSRFNSSLPQPPAYIKMRSKYKKEREFDRVFLAQELFGQKGRTMHRQNSSAGNKLRRKVSAPPSDSRTIWAMEFSKSGKYLAAAGADGIVRIWQVISTLDDRQKHEKQEMNESDDAASGTDVSSAEHLSAPVFIRQPIREYEGHTSTVLDLSWSKNDFLLSSSMDKTVRLWHVSRAECLCTFKHNDFVPSISFHPKDDRFFLAGSLDSRIRLWSIPDKKVAYAAQVQDMITAVAFTPDGKNAIAGCLGGTCFFYETEGMKYLSQISVRSRSGQNAKGSKITGIQASYDSRGDVKLLITSNDSRLRLYNLRDKNLEIKFRGNENNYSQIRGVLSDDARYVICGSEDRKAYIWSVGPCEVEKRDKRPVEMFEPHNSITTCVCFAPLKTRVLLGESEDPLYDLCNPPPVTLLSREEIFHSRTGSRSSSRPPSVANSMPGTPSEAKGEFKRPSQPASYLARSTHKNGNIIVTADFTGSIKVFRQDCAWAKRKGDDGDRASLFSRRNGRLGSGGSHMTKGSQPSLREGKMSTSLPGGSDRILHWRQGIASTPNVNDAARRGSPKDTPRSVSPSKSEDQQLADSPGTTSGWTGWATHNQANKDNPPRSVPQPGTSSTAAATDMSNLTSSARAAAAGIGNRAPDSPKTKPADDANPLLLSGGRSYLFWDTDEWKARGARQQAMHEAWLQKGAIHEEGETPFEQEGHLAVRPLLNRGHTNVSELSDERSDTSEGSFEEAREGIETAAAGGSSTAAIPGGGQALKCKNCGGTAFKARKTKTGNTLLVCTGCGEKIH